MSQYCRYCAFCFEGDGFFCADNPFEEPIKYMDEKDIKRSNKCKNFALSELGDVITGRQYKPRKKKPIVQDHQLSLFDVMEGSDADSN